MKTYMKFGLLVAVIIGTLGWLAAGGIKETKTYYRTIDEVNKLGNGAMDQRMRVGGDVVDGTIVRAGNEVRFTIHQDALKLNVVYDGIEPLPDTFRPGAQALADGKMRPDGTFHATKIQAKCASKYEAKPVQKQPVHAEKQAAL
jgi:cytochrome c-type biogenesis protein CcmE